ncbi:MAG: hypothetical protein IID18_05530, partial [Nitrospinae bacterium]|nr:hypothetical protein [Nitrospinota bacterium]
MEKRSRVIKLGLRGKLVLSMIVVGVFPLALVTFISYFQGNQSIERVIGSSFQALAHQSAGNIESIVLNEVTRLSALSKSPEIVRAVQNHEADAEVLPTLAAFLKENSASTKSLGLYLIDLKSGANEDVTINQLFQFTPLQSNYHIMGIALVERRPQTLPLKRMIELYVAHRR